MVTMPCRHKHAERGMSQDKEVGTGDDASEKQFHMFVNRRRFTEAEGARTEMTGGQIAALVSVPADVAVVRRGNTGDSPTVGLDEVLHIRKAEHFLVTRKVVEGGIDVPPRISRELALLASGGQMAAYIEAPRPVVLYRDVPVDRRNHSDLPAATDVIVPVPAGYPASMIDLAGLPVGSPLIGRVAGGNNSQGIVVVDGRQFQLGSYHPHNNGGGPPWDQTKHGFHTYFDHLLAWLAKLA